MSFQDPPPPAAAGTPVGRIIDWTCSGIALLLLAVACWVTLFRSMFFPSYVPSCMENCSIGDVYLGMGLTWGGVLLAVGVTAAGTLYAAIKKNVAVIWPLFGILILVSTNLVALSVLG